MVSQPSPKPPRSGKSSSNRKGTLNSVVQQKQSKSKSPSDRSSKTRSRRHATSTSPVSEVEALSRSHPNRSRNYQSRSLSNLNDYGNGNEEPHRRRSDNERHQTYLPPFESLSRRHSAPFPRKLPQVHHDEFDNMDVEERKAVGRKVSESINCHEGFFSDDQCLAIEKRIDKMTMEADEGCFKRYSVDRAPLRNKYFFGEGYTYGSQLERKGPGMEKLYPHGQIDPIPKWIKKYVIRPLEESKIIPKKWVNSAVVNDYLPGGCIVSHVDPIHIFDRPIVSASFLSDCALSFGCKFAFKPIRTSRPVHVQKLPRGCVTLISGYAADGITHCVRPQDVVSRRAVVILRRVLPDAPRLSDDDLFALQQHHYHPNPIAPPPRGPSPNRRRSDGRVLTDRDRRRRREEPEWISSPPLKRSRQDEPQKTKKSDEMAAKPKIPPSRMPHCYADPEENEEEDDEVMESVDEDKSPAATVSENVEESSAVSIACEETSGVTSSISISNFSNRKRRNYRKRAN